MTNEEARNLAVQTWSKGWVSYSSDCYIVRCKPYDQDGKHKNHYRVSGERGGRGPFGGNSWEECFEQGIKDEGVKK